MIIKSVIDCFFKYNIYKSGNNILHNVNASRDEIDFVEECRAVVLSQHDIAVQHGYKSYYDMITNGVLEASIRDGITKIYTKEESTKMKRQRIGTNEDK